MKNTDLSHTILAICVLSLLYVSCSSLFQNSTSSVSVVLPSDSGRAVCTEVPSCYAVYLLKDGAEYVTTDELGACKDTAPDYIASYFKDYLIDYKSNIIPGDKAVFYSVKSGIYGVYVISYNSSGKALSEGLVFGSVPDGEDVIFNIKDCVFDY